MWFNIFKREPKPFNEGFLPEEDGHKIYYCQYGNPKGIPVLSFHGGPGGSSRPKYAKLFNSRKYRFIQFDQRGCGNSQFSDLLFKNTTAKSVSDAAAVLRHLKIKDKVIVHGVSWGSTMALLFAEKYPQKVSHIIVSSVFLARPFDTSWVSRDSERFYPDIWDEMRIQIKKYDDIYPEYRRLLFSDNTDDNLKALTYLGSYEHMLGQINPSFTKPEELDENWLRSTRVAFFYEENKYFLSDKQILENAKKIKDIPALLVHNRMDFCCPVKQAWDLHKALPLSKLKIMPYYGHATPELHKAVKAEIKTFLKKNK